MVGLPCCHFFELFLALLITQVAVQSLLQLIPHYPQSRSNHLLYFVLLDGAPILVILVFVPGDAVPQILVRVIPSKNVSRPLAPIPLRQPEIRD